MAAGEAVKATVDRTELPIKKPWYPPITTLDARDVTAPPVFEVNALKDAPNVVVILLDDLGSEGFRTRGIKEQGLKGPGDRPRFGPGLTN